MGKQSPSIGRVVHYGIGVQSEQDGSTTFISRPALIVRVWNETGVNLQVFTDGGNDERYLGKDAEKGVVWKTSVQLSDVPAVGKCWWPPYVAPKA